MVVICERVARRAPWCTGSIIQRDRVAELLDAQGDDPDPSRQLDSAIRLTRSERFQCSRAFVQLSGGTSSLDSRDVLSLASLESLAPVVAVRIKLQGCSETCILLFQLFVLCIEFSESLLAPRENHRFALPNLGPRTDRCRFYTIYVRRPRYRLGLATAVIKPMGTKLVRAINKLGGTKFV